MLGAPEPGQAEGHAVVCAEPVHCTFGFLLSCFIFVGDL